MNYSAQHFNLEAGVYNYIKAVNTQCGEDRVFILRQVVYISTCLKMLNKHPDIGTVSLCFFLQTLQISDCLIVSLVKEVLWKVGINNIT